MTGTHEDVRNGVVAAMRGVYGDEWAADHEAVLRFSLEAQAVLQDLDGAHLLGEPQVDDSGILLRLWVDRPVPDLMTADAVAYAAFGRIAEQVFFAERLFEPGGLRYSFVTGTPRRGIVGVLLLSGPHAADFAERFRTRLAGGARYQA
jgi:hypothetical protein